MKNSPPNRALPALVLPPEAGRFTLCMLETVTNGRGDNLLDLAKN